jgi:hypothetical protein
MPEWRRFVPHCVSDGLKGVQAIMRRFFRLVLVVSFLSTALVFAARKVGAA